MELILKDKSKWKQDTERSLRRYMAQLKNLGIEYIRGPTQQWWW